MPRVPPKDGDAGALQIADHPASVCAPNDAGVGKAGQVGVMFESPRPRPFAGRNAEARAEHEATGGLLRPRRGRGFRAASPSAFLDIGLPPGARPEPAFATRPASTMTTELLGQGLHELHRHDDSRPSPGCSGSVFATAVVRSRTAGRIRMPLPRPPLGEISGRQRV